MDIRTIDSMVHDRTGFKSRLQHYARAASKAGEPVSFEFHAPSPQGGIEHATVRVEPNRTGASVIAGAPSRCPAGYHPSLSPEAAEFLDLLQDVILITDANPVHAPGPTVLYCNAAFTRTTGYCAAEIVGQTPRILQGDATEAERLRALSRALGEFQPCRVELTNYRKDGTPFLVEIDFTPVFDSTGWCTHWVSVQRDITQRRREESLLLQANRTELAQSIARSVVHDLNNHLSVMSLELEALVESSPRSESFAILEERIAESVETVKNLRRWVVQRRDTGPRSLSRELTRAFAMLPARARERFEPWAAEVDVAVQTRLGAEALADILLNLQLNATAAAPSATLELRVFHSEWRGQPAVTLEISDSGPGVPPELGDRIFLPYVSGGEGDGIGLFTVSRLAAEAGGAVHLLPSKRGRSGARFEIVVPVWGA